MLVELGLVEQRYQAVLEVLNDGATVTDVARRYGVARQTVHEWLRQLRGRGLGRVGGSVVAAVVVSASDGRRWSRRGSWRCAGSIRGGGRGRSCSGSSGRVSPRCRGGRRWSGAWSATGWSPRRPGSASGSDYKRWERSRSMELWQMDIVGGVRLVDGRKRRSCRGSMTTAGSWSRARVVARATARPVCDALEAAMRRHGVPDADPDRQRQGVHRPVRARSGAGAVRSDLHRERDHAHPHRAAVADHDRQGRALAQDAAPRVPRRQGLRLDRRRPGPARRVGAALQP